MEEKGGGDTEGEDVQRTEERRRRMRAETRKDFITTRLDTLPLTAL
jgi:hypothetical protein